tara:strand:+ start:2312 stop:3394 length:1083 start_codon:yes stop_codon:yes gene_type:complete
MPKAEINDDRESFFARPKTKRAIFGDKKIISIKRFRDILPALEHRKKGEAILIFPNIDLVPSHYRSAQNLSKRGDTVVLGTFGGDPKRLRENAWSPIKARIAAEEETYASIHLDKLENQRLIGWSWVDPENLTHLVRPSITIEGHRINAYSLKRGRIQDKIEFPKGVEGYSASDSPLKTIPVLVPSKSEGRKRKVQLEHITGLDDPRRHEEITRFTTRHECPFKQNDFTFRPPRTVTYCQHDAAAYAALGRKVGEDSGRVILQPFPLFSEPMLKLHLSLQYDTMKMDIDSKGNAKTRPLTFPEMDVVEMFAWAKHGNKATFFAPSMTRTYETGPPIKNRKRMRHYDWNHTTGGMPFSKFK